MEAKTVRFRIYIVMDYTAQGLKFTGVSWLKGKCLEFMDHFTTT